MNLSFLKKVTGALQNCLTLNFHNTFCTISLKIYTSKSKIFQTVLQIASDHATTQPLLRHRSTTVPPRSNMSSSGKRWKRFKNIFKQNRGWGCGPKATDVIQAEHISVFSSDQFHSHCPSSSAISWERHSCRRSIIGDDEDLTSTTFSLNIYKLSLN